MSVLLAEIPLRAGDRIRILDANGELMHEGVLTDNPSGSILPYSDLEDGVRSFYFTDTVYAIENQEYVIELEGTNRGFRVKPLYTPEFYEVLQDVKTLAVLKAGEAYEAVRSGALQKFLKNGYTEKVAHEVIDQLKRRLVKK